MLLKEIGLDSANGVRNSIDNDLILEIKMFKIFPSKKCQGRHKCELFLVKGGKIAMDCKMHVAGIFLCGA